MNKDELPSYVKLLDYYKRTKTEDAVLKDYVDIPVETQKEASQYLNSRSNAKEVRKYAIDLAVKNIEFGSAFPFAERIEKYILNGEIPENVVNKTTQEYFTRKDVEGIGEAHINFDKGIAVSKD